MTTNQAVRVLVYEWVWAITPNRCLLIGRHLGSGGVYPMLTNYHANNHVWTLHHTLRRLVQDATLVGTPRAVYRKMKLSVDRGVNSSVSAAIWPINPWPEFELVEFYG